MIMYAVVCVSMKPAELDSLWRTEFDADLRKHEMEKKMPDLTWRIHEVDASTLSWSRVS